MRRCTMLLCLCLVLAACGGGSGGGLPDGATTELANYILAYYGAASWHVQSAQQAPNPDNVLDSHFPDEVWCVVISPALINPNDPLHRQRDHFLIAHSPPDWYVQAPAFPTQQDFRNVGCTNG